MAHVSIPAFAKIVERSPEYIRRLMSTGVIPKGCIKRVGKRWHVDPVRAKKAMQKNLSPQHRKKTKTKTQKYPGIDKEVSYSQARSLNEQFKVAQARIQLGITMDKYILKSKVKDEIFSASRLCRDSLLSIPDRIAPLVAAENDPHRCKNILDKEITATIEDFLKMLNAVHR